MDPPKAKPHSGTVPLSGHFYEKMCFTVQPTNFEPKLQLCQINKFWRSTMQHSASS